MNLHQKFKNAPPLKLPSLHTPKHSTAYSRQESVLLKNVSFKNTKILELLEREKRISGLSKLEVQRATVNVEENETSSTKVFSYPRQFFSPTNAKSRVSLLRNDNSLTHIMQNSDYLSKVEHQHQQTTSISSDIQKPGREDMIKRIREMEVRVKDAKKRNKRERDRKVEGQELVKRA